MNNIVKKRVYDVIFGTDTPAGKMFDLVLLITILVSVFIVMIDSISSYHTQFSQYFYTAEWIFTIFFTAEYFLRIWCSPNPRAYIKSFFGIVDLLAILPTYIGLFITGTGFIIVVRLLRVLRIFRILKMVYFIKDANVLTRSLKMASRKILIFFFAVLVLVTIFGALMYAIEGENAGFTSIPISVYWAIVTITTVGYGDITPMTAAGQFIASLTMLLGYAIIAIPTGIISSELIEELKREKLTKYCGNCGKAGHDADAQYCKYCGSELPVDYLP